MEADPAMDGMTVTRRHAVMTFGLALLGGGLGGCGKSADGSTSPSERSIRFTNADGTVTDIPAKPHRILSTAASVTGTLLAIDAPLIASASAANGQYFPQWAGVAKERGIENIWPAGDVDIEAAIAVEPDLIVVSTGGADSALAQRAELQAIAPTILVDYGSQSWQDLAIQLGKAASLEKQAAARIAAFDRYVADARGKIAVPAGKVNIISYNGSGTTNPIATANGAHGRLLSGLGFTVEDPDPAWHAASEARGDFVWAPYEMLPRLTAATTFLLRANDERVAAFLGDPVLANLPSVRTRQVQSLGANSFRIDYYSATQIVDGIVKTFGK
ncbi:Fe2+-enterobactin ABC transporter substrate-binding protein [Sphingobium sp. BHU LFT2]|uniref:Fe2+-enterobactin ABC transporter substrate-binding protein n=1 Tax=Sphingobium sp. BHU LFT2 TaxID=2807634 RepID=UPI00333894A6